MVPMKHRTRDSQPHSMFAEAHQRTIKRKDALATSAVQVQVTTRLGAG
jgi:hypothetical protein